jgi:hypothetical protein
MPVKPSLWIVSAALCMGAAWPAGAQSVYKCGPRSYSQYPCSKRAVNTDDAPVPAKPNAKDVDVRRLEQNRVVARSLRRLPGESAEDFKVRQRRARLLQTDRDECDRLDTRIPVEEARLKNPDEVREAEAALVQSRKRFKQLRC